MVGVASLLLLSIVGAAQDKRKTIASPEPVYPEIARIAKLTGVVKVEIVIGPDGSVRETRVIGGHPVLVESVKGALKKWKYAPAPNETVTTLQFTFHP